MEKRTFAVTLKGSDIARFQTALDYRIVDNKDIEFLMPDGTTKVYHNCNQLDELVIEGDE